VKAEGRENGQMKMALNLKARARQILLGLLVGLFLVPLQTVQAQWAVYDGANHAAQLERMVQEAARWLETVNHYLEEIKKYETMIDKQVEQITRLGHILNKVDEQLARNKNLINTVANFGRTIRQIYQLQQDVRTMVTNRILAVERVWDRMRQGIFDPEQNMRDLEEYLRHSIGKASQQRIEYHELLLEQDAEFGEAVYQREVAYGRLARAEEAQKALEAALAAETSKPAGEQHGVESLLQQLSDCKQYIATLTQQIADYTLIINDKIQKFGVRIDAHARFGQAVVRETEAWREMTHLNDQTLRSLDALFDPEEPAEEVFDFPADEYKPFAIR
jgi:chromosome segregation ATPase